MKKYLLCPLLLLAISGCQGSPSNVPSRSNTSEPYCESFEGKGLPEPAKGMTWRHFEQGNIRLQIPDGWFTQEYNTPDAHVICVSQDPPNEHRVFKVGLTLNVVRNVKQTSDISAQDYALYLVGKHLEKAKERIDGSDHTVGIFRCVKGLVSEDLPAFPGIRFRVHLTALANLRTDTLYFYTFGAPEEQWDESWEIGFKIYNPMLFDTSY